jgi:hypothetical protein
MRPPLIRRLTALEQRMSSNDISTWSDEEIHTCRAELASQLSRYHGVEARQVDLAYGADVAPSVPNQRVREVLAAARVAARHRKEICGALAVE